MRRKLGVDRAARREDLEHPAGQALGKQFVDDKRQRIEGRDQVKGDAALLQHLMNVAVHGVSVGDMLGQEAREHHIIMVAEVAGVAADVEARLVIPLGQQRQFLRADVVDRIGVNGGRHFLQRERRPPPRAELQHVSGRVAGDDPLQRVAIAEHAVFPVLLRLHDPSP